MKLLTDYLNFSKKDKEKKLKKESRVFQFSFIFVVTIRIWCLLIVCEFALEDYHQKWLTGLRPGFKVRL